jgi:hypothetical protein
MRIQPRFRLRTLLIFTGLAAAFCWWWIIHPTARANEFIADFNQGDLAAYAQAVEAAGLTGPIDPPSLDPVTSKTILEALLGGPGT